MSRSISFIVLDPLIGYILLPSVSKTMPDHVSDEELRRVIGDFLDQGHVENIVAMFRRYPQYYSWTGELLRDERLSVRLGLSVLFEELREIQPEKVGLAVPSLTALLTSPQPHLRGEAASLLGIIGVSEGLVRVRDMVNDPDPGVREIVEMVLEEHS